MLQMIHRQSLVLDPYLDAARCSQFVGMDLGPQSVFRPSLQNPFGILHGKETLIAEFDEEIFTLVEAVTKIGDIKFKDEWNLFNIASR